MIRSLYRVTLLSPFYLNGPISSTFISTNIINGSRGFGRWHENQVTAKIFLVVAAWGDEYIYIYTSTIAQIIFISSKLVSENWVRFLKPRLEA